MATTTVSHWKPWEVEAWFKKIGMLDAAEQANLCNIDGSWLIEIVRNPDQVKDLLRISKWQAKILHKKISVLLQEQKAAEITAEAILNVSRATHRAKGPMAADAVSAPLMDSLDMSADELERSVEEARQSKHPSPPTTPDGHAESETAHGATRRLYDARNHHHHSPPKHVDHHSIPEQEARHRYPALFHWLAELRLEKFVGDFVFGH